MVYIDEDMIPAFKCVKCGHNYCKDEVFKKLDHHNSKEIICIYCEGY